jgi:hypothetical protein
VLVSACDNGAAHLILYCNLVAAGLWFLRISILTPVCSAQQQRHACMLIPNEPPRNYSSARFTVNRQVRLASDEYALHSGDSQRLPRAAKSGDVARQHSATAHLGWRAPIATRCSRAAPSYSPFRRARVSASSATAAIPVCTDGVGGPGSVLVLLVRALTHVILCHGLFTVVLARGRPWRASDLTFFVQALT